ncbi:MAG: YdcF family protein [Rhodospirillaceae bacterium]|nr:YdcF family protein [Rhodospirillaceae bacterium]
MLAAALSAMALWLSGGVWFASTLPVAVDDPATKTDAIVVWTGGSGRIGEGLDLLAAGMADKLFISGASEQVRIADLLQGRPEADLLGRRVTLGRMAVDTPGNAAETAQWVTRENAGSIRLVTAAYHMRRSLMELEAVRPDLLVVPHPVFPATVKADWWRWPGTASLIAEEYSKFLVAWARLQLGLADNAAVGAGAP